MQVSYVPVLGVLRELYARPRDMARFREYIGRLTGGGDDVVLPIGVANPMAREHALAKVDELLAMGADDVGAEAAREAHQRLRATNTVEIKASIVVADDVGGGWTNRYTTEAMVRFPTRGALSRPFATALGWTSESATRDDLRREVLAAVYRVAHQQQHGLPTSLGERMTQEGLTQRFAGMTPRLSAAELEQAAGIIQGLGDEPSYPTIFAALYGDDAAVELGYAPLGLPARAGFEVALVQALRSAP